jgi:hypothetical protein
LEHSIATFASVLAQKGTAMSREEMIQFLLLDGLEHRNDHEHSAWLKTAAEDELRILTQMSDNELAAEFARRGLCDDRLASEDLGEFDGDHVEIRGLVRGDAADCLLFE